MKLEIDKQAYSLNLTQFLRRQGWATIYDRRLNQTSYVKRLTRDFYPRLHLYINQTSERYILNIHLDQKQASYTGHRAHSADYEDNPLLNKAVNDLRVELENLKNTQSNPTTVEQKSWWHKLFK